MIHIEKEVRSQSLKEDAISVAKSAKDEWSESHVQVKVFTDGMTNTLVGCYVDKNPEDLVLIRVYGRNTQLFIDRGLEIRNMVLMNNAGLSPPLFCTFTNGICYGYTSGSVLDESLVRDPVISKQIAHQLAVMHSIKITKCEEPKPCLFPTLRRYLSLVPETFLQDLINTKTIRHIPDKKALSAEIDLLEKKLSSSDSPVVFCHNDLLLKNIIQKKDGVSFIDLEYADYNYQAYDIGNHFCEFAGVGTYKPHLYPDEAFQKEWLRSYLQSMNKLRNEERLENDCDPTESEIHKLFIQVNQFSLACHMLWGLWALVQAKHSTVDFNFSNYADLRIQDYFSRKKEFLSPQFSYNNCT